MAAFNLLILSSGKRTQQASNAAQFDFQSVRVGADNLPIVQGGSGGSAYFDFAARALRSSLAPSDVNDLTNKDYVDTAVASVSVVSWQNAVLDVQNTPPGSPVTGDRYIVDTVPTGAWVTHANKIAQWNGSSWVFTVPTAGTFVDVIAYTSGIYFYTGSAWATKDFEATTASSGVKMVGRDIRRDDAVAKVNDNAGSITLNQIVYVKANGNVDLARADVATLEAFALGAVGVATIASAASDDIIVRQGAILSGLSGLTPGGLYYVSKSTAGAIALYSAITFATGDHVYSVGRALTATTLLFDPRFEFVF